jgi:GNAT superfamily N-acetyltransferase
VDIRSATPDDSEAIERVRIRGWQAAYRDIFPPDELDRLPVDPSRWQATLERPPRGYVCFVAEEDGALLGFADVSPSRHDPDRHGELRGLYVDPDAWSRGVGRALIARAEEELSLTWDEAIVWTLRDVPRTRRFYELAGWEADGEQDTFERHGVSAPIVRYRKRLTRSASRL